MNRPSAPTATLVLLVGLCTTGVDAAANPDAIYGRIQDGEGRPVAGAIVYGRGPIFMARLAERMGQEEFDAFLRDYYESHEWGIGTGETFEELAEEHCRCDLGPLFEEWVYEQ